jgi:hypothetical protein
MKPHPSIIYSEAQSDEAHRLWKASCGHHSIAAACGVTLDLIRQHVPHHKGWMNPTNVSATLDSLGVAVELTKGHVLRGRQGFCQGINRIQFEGPWLDPGKPAAAAYRYTHYVAVARDRVLDTVINNWQWLDLHRWLNAIDQYSKEDGTTGYHVTHHWKIEYDLQP